LRKNPEAKPNQKPIRPQLEPQIKSTIMNNQSPFLPQSSVEQKNQARARVKIAVFFVLAVNGIGLMALLMQGCRQEKPASETEVATNPPTTEAAAPPVDTNPAPAVTMTNAPTVAETPTVATPSTPPVVSETEYTIVQGDTLSAIATKNHVKVAALEAANPGIEPTKLKIGQKIHIPAPATSTVAMATGGSTDSTSSGQVYTVKSGDTLLKIASATGASVKSIRSENNLKTDKIVVGQKLKIPVKASATPALTPAAPSSTDSASALSLSTSAPPTTAPTH
jgi:LysM repeat protein